MTGSAPSAREKSQRRQKAFTAAAAATARRLAGSLTGRLLKSQTAAPAAHASARRTYGARNAPEIWNQRTLPPPVPVQALCRGPNTLTRSTLFDCGCPGGHVAQPAGFDVLGKRYHLQ